MTIYAGVIGTGFAARKRIETLRQLSQVQVKAIASRSLERAQAFANKQGLTAVSIENFWQSPLDLVFICTVNSDHATLVRQALEHNQHVVVEYPLALDVDQAQQLLRLARQRQRLLHVEHIELIGGLHLAMKHHIAAVGSPRYAHYRTLAPKQPAPKKWSYCAELLGFPLMAALSRLQRLTDLLGPVNTVACQGEIRPREGYFRSCLYSAQLNFRSGALAELTYGKGEGLWQSCRYMEVRGDQGCLSFDGNQGRLVTAVGEQAIAAAPRQGLFRKDTEWVLEHLLQGKPLYVQPEQSIYALQVAAALQQATVSGERVTVESVGTV